MERAAFTFSLQEAGGLLYLADEKFGGYPVNGFHEFFGGRSGLSDLTLSGAVMAMTLYQDDGYNVRILKGDPTNEELSEWTSRVSWKLNVPSGRIAVSGICDEGLSDYMAAWEPAGDGGDYELGVFVEVPPCQYTVTVYSYPPNDLAGGWMALSERRVFREAFGSSDFEKPDAYFKRTRPAETPRAWISEGWEDANFLDFLVRLTPLEEDPVPPRFEDDGTIKWEFRKPEICPVGIELPV